MGKKGGVWERIKRVFHPVVNPAKQKTEITIIENKQITVWSHKGVLCAENELVSLACGDFILRIEGEGLQLEAVSSTGTLITGKLQSVSFT
jgi:sporulation protein YqfC